MRAASNQAIIHLNQNMFASRPTILASLQMQVAEAMVTSSAAAAAALAAIPHFFKEEECSLFSVCQGLSHLTTARCNARVRICYPKRINSLDMSKGGEDNVYLAEEKRNE